MNLKLFDQSRVNWPFEAIEKFLPNLRFNPFIKIKPIFLDVIKIHDQFTENLWFIDWNRKSNFLNTFFLFILLLLLILISMLLLLNLLLLRISHGEELIFRVVEKMVWKRESVALWVAQVCEMRVKCVL